MRFHTSPVSRLGGKDPLLVLSFASFLVIIFCVNSSSHNRQMGYSASNNIFWKSQPFISQSRCVYNPPPRSIKSNVRLSSHLCHTLYGKCSIQRAVAFCAKESAGESYHNDNRALDAVLRLYAAIENRNLNQLSDVIGDECRCVSNFVSSFQSIHGKKQVMDFFSTLVRSLGNNMEFVVQPVSSEGMHVGVSWKLEWKQTHFPLGKGFGFYICHVYQGKLVIRNVEMFIEPLLHVEPLRLKMVAIITSAVEKVGQRRRAALLSLLLLVALVFISLTF